MTYNLLGKTVRGRFAFPSGVIATNSDAMQWIIKNIPQIGAVVGKSATIEPRQGNREDIYVQASSDCGWNAVAFTNPGLDETIRDFSSLKSQFPDTVFLMPQLGENNPDNFATCIKAFEKAACADGYEVNVSCGHANRGGIQLSQPDMVRNIFCAMREHTKKPLIAKLNASIPNLPKLVTAALEGGANALSLINTLPGPNPELKNKFGGMSGPVIFPVLCQTLKNIRQMTDVPILAMGGISGASDIRTLEKIDNTLFYEIGTALAEMTSLQIAQYYRQLEIDLQDGTDEAAKLTQQKKAHSYRPFIVKQVEELSPNLKLFRFYESVHAGIGQFIFIKVGDNRPWAGKEDDEYAKPFSVARDDHGLELLIKKVGPATEKIFDLKVNQVARIKGPYGQPFQFPQDSAVILLGAGCGIAPIMHAAQHHRGKKIFIIGARTADELAYIEAFKEMGDVLISTDDGSAGRSGFITDTLNHFLQNNPLNHPCFFNCGPEVVMGIADEIERNYTTPDRIFHLAERMTCCGVGICGKCTIPSGQRACVDGPVFTASELTPGICHRDKVGRKVFLKKPCKPN